MPDRFVSQPRIAMLASETREGSPLWGDPVALCCRAGFDLAIGSEPTTAECVIYSWHTDQRECGLRVYRALAESVFLSRSLRYAPADVDALADALAVPPWITPSSAAMLIERQLHYPERRLRELAAR